MLVSNCANNGQWGKTYTFNDGSDTFMVQITNLDVPSPFQKNINTLCNGIFRNSERSG